MNINTSIAEPMKAFLDASGNWLKAWISLALIPYLAVTSSAWSIGYWGSFDINPLDHVGLAELAPYSLPRIGHVLFGFFIYGLPAAIVSILTTEWVEERMRVAYRKWIQKQTIQTAVEAKASPNLVLAIFAALMGAYIITLTANPHDITAFELALPVIVSMLLLRAFFQNTRMAVIVFLGLILSSPMTTFMMGLRDGGRVATNQKSSLIVFHTVDQKSSAFVYLGKLDQTAFYYEPCIDILLMKPAPHTDDIFSPRSTVDCERQQLFHPASVNSEDSGL